ncbi:hypothetical protein ACRWUK_24055, partial [Escherichia coli]
MIIGYARKSTHLQDVTHQVDELTKAGCEQIYHEQIWHCCKVSDEAAFCLIQRGTVAKLAMRQPFVLFKGLTFQKLCLPGAFRPG